MHRQIEGMQILAAGGLALKRDEGEVDPQAIQHAHNLFSFIRAGQKTSYLLRLARKPFLLEHGTAFQPGGVHQLDR